MSSKRIIKASSLGDLPSLSGGHLRPERRVIPRRSVIMAGTRPTCRAESSPSPGRSSTPAGSSRLAKKPGAHGGLPEPSNLDHNALSVNQIVEQKVKEFEERFQSEKEQAFKDGFEEGRSRGYRQGIETAEKAEKLLANLIEEIGSQRERILSEAEKVLTRLSLEIAEAVIGEAALKASGEALDHNLKRCLAALGGSGEVKIRISPSDYEFARESFCSLPGRPGGEMADDRFTFVFEPDPSISPGGCFVETDAGAVDARLETQLALMKDNIAKLI